MKSIYFIINRIFQLYINKLNRLGSWTPVPVPITFHHIKYRGQASYGPLAIFFLKGRYSHRFTLLPFFNALLLLIIVLTGL